MKHEINIHFRSENFTDQNIADLYESAGFGKSSDYLVIPEFKEKFLGPNITCAYAESAAAGLIGLVRVMSDDILTTYVAEICVHPDWQRLGVGSSLCAAIISRFRHTAIFADAFRGTEQLFATAGLTPKSKLVACSRAPDAFSGAAN